MHEPTFYLVVDGATAAWSRLDELHRSDCGDEVAQGILLGDDTLVRRIRAVLGPDSPTRRVRVLHPNVYYEFTPDRDRPEDVAAAMVFAGAGRGVLSEAGWRVLDAALGLDDEAETEAEAEAVERVF